MRAVPQLKIMFMSFQSPAVDIHLHQLKSMTKSPTKGQVNPKLQLNTTIFGEISIIDFSNIILGDYFHFKCRNTEM